MEKILIDGTTFSKKTDGLTQYGYSIILELVKDTSKDFTLIVRKNEIPETYSDKIKNLGSNFHLEEVDIPVIGPKRDIVFTRWLKANKNLFDKIYEPSAQYPAGSKGGIYTIHDILYEEFPEKLGKYSYLKKCYLHYVVHRGLRKAGRIIAVSQYTKNEILKYHGKKFEKKISVITEGYEHLNGYRINRDDSVVRDILSSCKNFFLYIGSSRGHKNLHNLFLAYQKTCCDWDLVIVGRMDRLSNEDKILVNNINNTSKKVRFTGWIEDDQMYTILSQANAFVFPSKSEGFGIPILESYFFNVPLLCSDIPVFQEVAGDACIKFNPYDIDDISRVLDAFSKMQKEEIDDLLMRQKQQLSLYSWKNAAKDINELL